MTLRKLDLPARHLWIVFWLFICVHGLLIIHNVVIPDSFLRGDRSPQRLEKIQSVFGINDHDRTFKHINIKPDVNTSFIDRVLLIGNMGDYFAHGIFYRIGGAYLVIFLQVMLHFLAVVCVYRLALLLDVPSSLSLFCTMLYVLLPGSLMQPHMLVTEGLYNPFVVFAFYFIVRCFIEDNHIMFIYGMMMLSIAIYMKFQLVIYPVILSFIIIYYMPRKWYTRALPSILICFVGPIGWYLFVHAQGGVPSLPDDRLGAELFMKANRLAAMADFKVDSSAYPDNEMTLTEFLAIVIHHPKDFILLTIYDIVNLFCNPGVNHFAAKYLNVLDTEHGGGAFYWSDIRDEGGYWGLFKKILSVGPAFAVSVVVSTLVWEFVVLVSAIGLGKFIVNRAIAPITRATLVSYLVYGSVVVLIARNTRWAYRTHVEFIIVILFAFGIAALRDWLNRGQTLVYAKLSQVELADKAEQRHTESPRG